jgi:hypothetical protein
VNFSRIVTPAQAGIQDPARHFYPTSGATPTSPPCNSTQLARSLEAQQSSQGVRELKQIPPNSTSPHALHLNFSLGSVSGVQVVDQTPRRSVLEFICSVCNGTFWPHIQLGNKTMKPTRKRILLFSFAMLVVYAAQALTIGYPVTVMNKLSEPIEVEISQYHANNFNGTQPDKFTDDLIVNKKRISLYPGEARKIKYTSASGGFWLVWKVLSPPAYSGESGMFSLLKGERTMNIE